MRNSCKYYYGISEWPTGWSSSHKHPINAFENLVTKYDLFKVAIRYACILHVIHQSCSHFPFIIMALLLAAGITLAVKSRRNKKSFSFIGGILLASWPIAIILYAFVATIRESRYRYRVM